MILTLVDTARVDLGPLRNGRVMERNIYEKDGQRVIFEKGKPVPVLLVYKRPKLYVTKGR